MASAQPPALSAAESVAAGLADDLEEMRARVAAIGSRTAKLERGGCILGQRRRVKLLMLHGWGQNEGRFSQNSKDIRKILQQNGIDPIYCSAPNRLPELPPPELPPPSAPAPAPKHAHATPLDARAWFTYNVADPGDYSTYLDQTARHLDYPGWDASVAALRQLEVEHGWFDGVLGFSQGAVAAHLLLAAQPLRRPLGFGVFVSGFAARTVPRPQNGGALLTALTFHVSGSNDTSVPPEHQDELAACFLDPSTGGPPDVYRHPKAHAIQLPKPTLREIVDGIDAMATVALSNKAMLARMALVKTAGTDSA